MGQIITSLIIFFLEVKKSNKVYKSNKDNNRIFSAIKLFLLGVTIFVSFKSVTTVYVVQAENIMLKEEIKELVELKNENESLKLKNELLSSTLEYFIGSNHVEQINKDKQKDKKPKSK